MLGHLLRSKEPFLSDTTLGDTSIFDTEFQFQLYKSLFMKLLLNDDPCFVTPLADKISVSLKMDLACIFSVSLQLNLDVPFESGRVFVAYFQIVYCTLGATLIRKRHHHFIAV